MPSTLTSLTKLVLSDTPGLSLNNVRDFSSLRVLDLSRCESLTPAALQPAAESCGQLETLLLDGCHMLTTLKLTMPHLQVSSLLHVCVLVVQGVLLCVCLSCRFLMLTCCLSCCVSCYSSPVHALLSCTLHSGTTLILLIPPSSFVMCCFRC
jgi:hypothetical protein